MAKDRESTAAKVKLMFEERGTMIQADQESYLNAFESEAENKGFNFLETNVCKKQKKRNGD